MNDPQAPEIIWYILVLVLVLSALTARRLTFGQVLRSLIGWLFIGTIAYVAIDHREQLSGWAARIGLGDQSVAGGTTRIRQSVDGHFWADVEINGVHRRMLIDSGATTTALSQQTAQAAGVDISGGFPVLLNTANGTITAKRATIDTLVIGNLETDKLEAVVSPNFGNLDVIGMNFLSRLGSWRVEKGVLILEPDTSQDEDSNSDRT
ncbi:retropepsin-like aspartic protease family protein [Stakelama marina]|uniref:TIGR02281 family clan AA aspartic protease n=1 Tax=Stakelama marina TaxID=2826939 RepID=A0A8T4IAL1_9SPHN|nr:TIGR02281 family clan AA aspartic protease [Stakelama marina]MBR0551590.1 TIGR02281 family clan AA aspartic protease [Stakelama marina]